MNIKRKLSIGILSVFAAVSLLTLTSMTIMDTKETNTYLEITLDIKSENRGSAAGVYLKYKQPFLKQINGATSKELLIRTEDVQVLHGFESEDEAKAYLTTKLFENDVVSELKPFLESNPEIRIYSVFKN
ncbi:hypothetical protein [uncultured Dokdonia sp.]|uniref:hypothetical protein n=1 Tax=uncultured Dokdonia sp. TaxID=575653 RepID=UPI0026397567|nr:hypothetical protein [uncultured Dokdonia sp.]